MNSFKNNLTEEVMFEFHPVFERSDGSDIQKASLVWLGDEESRPVYIGQGSRPNITPKMDSVLWDFVKTKNMDQKMFRALVEGRLPPKPPTSTDKVQAIGPDGSSICLDKDTLQQAALLSKMKSSFGPAACIQAMMMLMANKEEEPKSEDIAAFKTAMQMAQTMMNKQEGEPSSTTMDQAVAGPSGSLTWPAVEPKDEKKVSFKLNPQ